MSDVASGGGGPTKGGHREAIVSHRSDAAVVLLTAARRLHRRRIGRRNRSTFWSALVRVAELTSPLEFWPMDFRKYLGQQFTVENRPGAGGTIAGGIAAKAPKDGYTIVSLSMGHSVSAVMVKQVPYDPVADFAPVGIFTNSAFVVVVPKNSPATDIKSLVEFVNKQPGKLNYSTVGLGSTQHLVAEHLRQRASINAQAVSYRTTGEVVSALLRGDAAFAVELIIRSAAKWIR